MLALLEKLSKLLLLFPLCFSLCKNTFRHNSFFKVINKRQSWFRDWWSIYSLVKNCIKLVSIDLKAISQLLLEPTCLQVKVWNSVTSLLGHTKHPSYVLLLGFGVWHWEPEHPHRKKFPHTSTHHHSQMSDENLEFQHSHVPELVVL